MSARGLPPLAVAGVGAVGAFGAGLPHWAAALSAPPPAPQREALPGGGFVSCLRADAADLSRFMDRGRLRRIDHYGRLALLGAHLALADAGVAAPLGPRAALVIATGHGPLSSTFAFLDTIIEGDDSLASPTAFSNSVHNAAAAQVSMALDITGPNLTVTQLGFSVTSALLGAAHLLAEGAADGVLFGAVDEIHPAYACGLGELFPGTAFGEGAAFFWLTPRPADARYGLLSVSLETRPEIAPGELCYAPAQTPDFPGAAEAKDTQPLLGALPTRAALDLAAAAACLRGGVAQQAKVLEWDGISCFGSLRLSL